MMNWMDIQDKAIIGLVSIAIQHIQNKDYEDAEATLLSMIMTMERTRGEA